MIKDKIIGVLEAAIHEARDTGLLPPVNLPEVTVERPARPGHGDYSSSFALKLGREANINPVEVARKIVNLVKPVPEIDKIEVAPPGFINFTLKPDWLAAQAAAILEAGKAFGNLTIGGGKKVQVEFVSVNPTGPLHVGHGRGAVLGSALAGILSAAGFSVVKEYYVNDAGAQMVAFYRSVYARYLQGLGKSAEMPANGYQGAYVLDLAREIIKEKGDYYAGLPEEKGVDEIGRYGMEKQLAAIRTDLDMLGVKFDVWFSERSLFDGGQYQKVMKLLKDKGYVAERESAIWFVSSALGEDKDNVLVRSNGTPTYFASDCAYHYNKFVERGFDQVIDIWGADHQGHVPRIKALVTAIGQDPNRLKVLITQMVTLKRGDEEIKISKRSGELVTLRELVDDVGVDACRFFFLSRSADAQMDFDLKLAKEQSAENPVYYVQYAHARIASILRLATERQIDYAAGNVSLLVSPAEQALIRKMIELPETLKLIAETLEPQHLCYYVQELATVFHSFYKQCRVVSKDEELSKARLKLVDATRTVLAKSLDLMGIKAPEVM